MATGQVSAIQRFCRLPAPSYEKIYADANSILDEIISQCHTFRRANQDINLEEMVSFLSHGCKTLQNASILLKSKFAQVVNIYLPLMKSTMNEDCVNQLVTFLCQSLTSVKSSLVSEFMKALALTLTGTGAFLNEDIIFQLLGEDGVIWMYLGQTDWMLRSYAIQCLGNMCLRSQHVGILAKENIQLCYSKLLDTLRVFVFDDSKEIEHFKLINVTLKAIQKILSGITMHDNIVEPEFAVLLLKIFLVYGLPGYVGIVGRLRVVLPSRKSDDLETMDKIYPTKKKEKSTMTKKVNAKKGRKKKKKNLNNSLQEAYDSVAEADQSGYGIMGNWRQIQSQSSSESEFSDSEMNITDQINSLTLKIRLNCAMTLQEILRCCDRRSRFACWSVLVPEILSPENPSLLLSFITETSPKIKSTLLMAIMELVDGSRGFLDSVITTQTNSSNFASAGRPFTPYSAKITQSLQLLHDEFMTSIRDCDDEDMKEKMIKCLTLIMLNAPYKKLQKNYLPSIMKLVVNSLNSKEHSLCQAVLTCIAACISIQPDNTQVYQILASTQPPVDVTNSRSLSTTPSKEKPPAKSSLLSPSKNERTNTVLNSISQSKSSPVTPLKDNIDELKTGEKSWLVTHSLRSLYLATKDNAFELRISSEYIQLLTVILRCHPHLLPDQQVEKLINFTTNVFMFSTDVSISFHGIKLLEEFSKYYDTLHQQKGQDAQGARFWKRMLSGAIPQYLHGEPTKPVKGQAAICDWISNIGSHMFAIMKNPEQIFVKTILIGLTESEEPLIAAAAVRALGVIIDYNSMIDDVWFVVDATTSILKQLNSSAVSVRLKAAWSLANLCDFIAKNGFLANDYPETMVNTLLQDSTKAALGNEKISPNGVRAIGNLLKAFPKRLFDNTKFQDAIQESVLAIIKNVRIGQMKTRWNACYACRYIFENPDFPIGSVSWTNELFSAILEALSDCKNFKVRISAAVALSSLASRSKYGDTELFAKIWEETLKALEKSEELTDFTEFKHKENLQEQTIILLLHLLSLTKENDLIALQNVSKPHREIFLINCRKCLSQFEVNEDDGKHPPSPNAKVDAYLDYPIRKELSEDEKQKNSVLEKHMLATKTNLCRIKNFDRTLGIVDIIQKALCLDT